VALPLHLGNYLSIVSLGTIVYDRPAYHNKRYIFPVGYRALRYHRSLVNPTNKCKYLCEILDSGDKPLFKVTCEEEPNKPISKDSASGVWTIIEKRLAEKTSSRRKTITVSGMHRFGLAFASVLHLIQGLPNAEKCTMYEFKTFTTDKNAPAEEDDEDDDELMNE